MTHTTTLETTDCRTAEAPTIGPWSCAAHRPGTITHPNQLVVAPSEWLPATVPGTVAAMLDANGRWEFDQPTDIDSQDWWYRTTFAAPIRDNDGPCLLHFDGLATLAEVWMNGQQILTTENMFRAYSVDVAPFLQRENELVIGFRSLNEDLKRKRPRPRWKTKVVANQQLRWRRTSLQGRIPGWSPTAPAVGPWRAIRLDSTPAAVRGLRIAPRLEGSTGFVRVSATLVDENVERAFLRIGSQEFAVSIRGTSGSRSIETEIQIENPPQWWPHTHGEPQLCDCELRLESANSAETVYRSKIGFRSLTVDTTSGFAVRINGEPIYCRGACWTVADILTHVGTEASLRHDLQLARDAGVNMVRVGGTMVYESDLFYRLCDELGILVWQDFMFANMDYPVADEAFRSEIRGEATEQLQRLAAHPSVAVYCGNSEVAQQAAMLGMPKELWHHDWFADELPHLCAEYHVGTAYVPSTPSGGVLPFHANTGVTHFYGIGAYLRSATELRKTNVKFTPECLGFANVPDAATIDAIADGATVVMHDPRWKRRTPRDSGAGWDFEDVRDHYFRELFNLDPATVRYRDHSRYLQLSRIASGEMMAQAFSEWRSPHSENGGGLVWFYKDLWPGAGWGVVDALGRPKAAYYALKRVWNSRQVTITDEGINGLHLHLINETAAPVSGFLEVTLLKEPKTVIARQEIAVELAPRARQTHSADEILGGFYDVSYAYRFGPPQHDVVIVTLRDEQREIISQALHLIQRRDPPMLAGVSIEANAEMIDDVTVKLTIQSDQLLHGVSIQADGYLPDDNYFSLPPQQPKQVLFRARGQSRKTFQAELEALNLEAGKFVSLTAPRGSSGSETCR